MSAWIIIEPTVRDDVSYFYLFLKNSTITYFCYHPLAFFFWTALPTAYHFHSHLPAIATGLSSVQTTRESSITQIKTALNHRDHAIIVHQSFAQSCSFLSSVNYLSSIFYVTKNTIFCCVEYQ